MELSKGTSDHLNMSHSRTSPCVREDRLVCAVNSMNVHTLYKKKSPSCKVELNLLLPSQQGKQTSLDKHDNNASLCADWDELMPLVYLQLSGNKTCSGNLCIDWQVSKHNSYL